MVRTTFQQRRKTLSNALRPALTAGADAADLLTEAGIDPRRRPETLTLSELAAIALLDLRTSAAHRDR
jgi:16S rRNA (adenine1518-N6/adenine1519-N6)-dimethyltransferase